MGRYIRGSYAANLVASKRETHRSDDPNDEADEETVKWRPGKKIHNKKKNYIEYNLPEWICDRWRTDCEGGSGSFRGR